MVSPITHTKQPPDFSRAEGIPETEKPPPRKIRRTATKPTKRPRRKNSVKSLSRFVDIPMDLFTEIASYLFPSDILSLSRSSKLFRNLIMRRSSRHIWTNAMRNVELLPPCPPDMSEPVYLALLFSKYCTGCGRSIACHIYGELRMRLCTPCRETRLIALGTLPSELDSLVHKIGIYPGNTKRRGCCGPRPTYYTTAEANEINEKLKELKQAGDQIALEAWKSERVEVVQSRSREAGAIHHFLARSDPPGGFGNYGRKP
ncbi:unnamed protein product [Rhizoctonia solani]|uniref:F-box domain-containing protein n=1 Tax=Rhizoctonia solani TaxID=456999 RepID=A0A8H3D4M9_9AGAM|nr:unnamed protein product [Rhizoctonia solani]